MKLSLKTLEIICFFIACLLGSIFHFVYKWTGGNSAAGLFFPVNESTWEHLKLVFYPIVAVSIPEYFMLKKKYPGFFCVKFISSLLGMGLTIVLFYTYSGVYGQNVDALNIILYFAAMAAAFYYCYRTLTGSGKPPISGFLCKAGIVIMILLFAVFTIYPPEIGLFLPPV